MDFANLRYTYCNIRYKKKKKKKDDGFGYQHSAYCAENSRGENPSYG